MESTSIFCQNCAKDLTEFDSESKDRRLCPDCDSEKRNTFAVIDVPTIHHGFTEVSCVVRKANGFVKQEETTRSSISDKTGKLVKITKIIDRSHPEETVFTHLVQEKSEHETFKTIHVHTDKHPAKHRK